MRWREPEKGGGQAEIGHLNSDTGKMLKKNVSDICGTLLSVFNESIELYEKRYCLQNRCLVKHNTAVSAYYA